MMQFTKQSWFTTTLVGAAASVALLTGCSSSDASDGDVYRNTQKVEPKAEPEPKRDGLENPQCAAAPGCDQGDLEVTSCASNTTCYERSACGTTIVCAVGK
jgi:hypothetical protein